MDTSTDRLGVMLRAVLLFRFASERDVRALLKLRLDVDADQARRFGKNRWSTTISEASVSRGLKASRVLVAEQDKTIVAALRMQTKKPWAIDLTYLSDPTRVLAVSRPSRRPSIFTTSTSTLHCSELVLDAT